MCHKTFWCCVVALLCVSQTKAGVNNEVRVAHNWETERDGAGNQQKTSAHVIGSTNAEVRRGTESSGQDIKSFEMSTQGANFDKGSTKQENLSNRFNSGGTKQDTPSGRSKNTDFKSGSGGSIQIGEGYSHSNPGRSGDKTGPLDSSMHHQGGSVPSMRYDDPKLQRGLNSETSGNTGTYAFDSSMQRTPGSTQLSSVGIERTSQVAGNGVLIQNPEVLKYNSGGTVQNTKADFPSYSTGVSVTANSGGSIQRQPNKLTTFNTTNNDGGGYVLSTGSSIPQNSVGINTVNRGGGGYVLPSGISIPQNSVGVNTVYGGGGYVSPSGNSIPQNSVGINTANSGGGGYVLPSWSSNPQNSVGVQQGSLTPTGTLQTTRINTGAPVTASGGGSVYTPTYKPGGTVSISGGGFGGSYGQTTGGSIPGYNIGMQQGFRISPIGISGAVRSGGGQINGGMLSGRSQSGVMFPVGTQQVKVGYGTSAATLPMGYIPQTQVRSVKQIPTIERLSVPVRRVDPVYTSFATSGRVPGKSTSGNTYFSMPSTGVTMTYGQNQVRSPSFSSGTQLRIPSTNIQYMSSARVPTGAVQVYG